MEVFLMLSLAAKVNFLPGRQMATEFSSDEEDLEEVNLSLSLASESSDRSWTSVVDRQMSLSAEVAFRVRYDTLNAQIL